MSITQVLSNTKWSGDCNHWFYEYRSPTIRYLEVCNGHSALDLQRLRYTIDYRIVIR